MNQPEQTHAAFWKTTVTLLRHEARTLWQNRMACAVLLLAIATALFLRIEQDRRGTLPTEVCYVLYWEEDALVRHLRDAAARASELHGLHIEVQPAEKFSGEDGVIRYPPGSHSIQLRSRSEAAKQPGRVILYWYSGSDPSAILPYAEWFESTVFTFLDHDLEWDVAVKSLRPELVVLGKQTRVTLDTFREPRQSWSVLVCVLLFFTACHLPKLSLAEANAGGMILSVVTTPAGWQGISRTLRLFYGLLSIAAATLLTAILQPAALYSATYWWCLLCAVLVYSGVAFVIGSWSRSVASASAGTIGYALFSGAVCVVLIAIARSRETIPQLHMIVEVALVQSLKSAAAGLSFDIHNRGLTALLTWGLFWQLAGEFSFRRLQHR